ncbi:MAG TPA: carbon-nitrogen hydrolase family protein [Chitinophagaceae bacterium]|nr:carbon-nitrogen hydrolase family protein [Chitinophagaceae bacterium]
MKVALASPPFPKSIDDALFHVEKLVKEASDEKAAIICFPETFIPGYPLPEYKPEKSAPENMQNALQHVCAMANKNHIAIILPMDWFMDENMLNVAFVISSTGKVLGFQSKNQLDPSEDNIWIAGTERKLFEVEGLKFGITICHEGFRYPESVRWAAMNGASVVFHPQCTSGNVSGMLPTEWGDRKSPYYEKAMMMRAIENTIYFASVNYAAKYQDSATSLIAPDGTCIIHQPYGKECIIAADIDPEKATGLLAKRFRAQLYNSNV